MISFSECDFPWNSIHSKDAVYHIAWLNRDLFTLASGTKIDEPRSGWSPFTLPYILVQACGGLKCRSEPSPVCRRLGKSMVHLIGFLDTGFVLPFLPAEMGFTWKGLKHFLLAEQPVAHSVKAEQLQYIGSPSLLLQPRKPFRSVCVCPVITVALFVSVLMGQTPTTQDLRVFDRFKTS